MIEKSSPEFAELLGEAIVSLSRYFCGVEDAHAPPGGKITGRSKIDPVYKRVTENRDGPTPQARAAYSSCGDQLHAILERVGVRQHALNRASQKNYQFGANITRLQQFPFGNVAPKDASYRPPAGSLCLIWTTGFDAHAFVILGSGTDANHIETGNYGAGGMSSATEPGADVADSPCVLERGATFHDAYGVAVPGKPTGYLLIGGSRRRLHYVIEPSRIVPYIDAQIDLSGAAVTGELVDALGARYE